MHHLGKTLLILPLLIAYGGCAASKAKKQVCVIGAGLSGLTSTRYLSKYPDEFEPIVFEKQSDTGGLWIYSDSNTIDKHGLPVHSSAYKSLRSNAPKEITTYPGDPPIYGENRSFVSRETILQYLRNFTEYNDLRKYIQFNTNVEKVSPLDDMKWLVSSRNLNDNTTKETICDVAMIASGNTVTGYVQKMPGIETFPGKVMHSHFYRTPDVYANQTVAILGAALSGVDIAIDISRTAKTVYLSHRHQTSQAELPSNVVQVAGIIAAENDNLLLLDGKRIKADSLLLCTGYSHSYPFLDSSSGIVIEEDGKYIRSLYKHIVNIERPTMAFLNVPDPGFPLLVPHSQAQFYVAVLRGKIKLPDREQMLKEAEVPEGKPLFKAHYMIFGLADYVNGLSTAAGYDPLPPYYDAAWRLLMYQIATDPMHFQEKDLHINDDGTVRYVLRT